MGLLLASSTVPGFSFLLSGCVLLVCQMGWVLCTLPLLAVVSIVCAFRVVSACEVWPSLGCVLDRFVLLSLSAVPAVVRCPPFLVQLCVLCLEVILCCVSFLLLLMM